MRGILSFVLAFGVASAAVAQEASLASKLFRPNPAALALADGGVTAPGKAPRASVAEGSSQLQPGKALMLSAIMPGAGEYYAGKKLRAALFFAIEVAAWTGVIYYYSKGMDKDREFKAFADAHFYEEVYRSYEFKIAKDVRYGDSSAYKGDRAAWDNEPWNVKIHYLPPPPEGTGGFTHELPSAQERESNKSMKQQYYEMIGKYIHQFGFGWDDVFVWGPDSVASNVTFRYDDGGTPQFDNQFQGAARSLYYMDVRGKSNRLLEASSLAIQIAMLNHIVSALDASFTVRAMNRRGEAKVGFRKIDYDGRPVAVGGLNFQW